MGVEGWQSRRIAELFNMQLGKMLSPAASAGPNQAPYITNRHVQWDRVLVDDLDTMSFTSPEREKFSLERNDLLVCEGGEVGRSALWLDNAREVFFQKAIHRLRPRVPDVLPSFALRLMHRAASSGAFTDYTSQTSIAHLTQEKLGQVEFTLPPLPEQRAIARVLDTIDDAIRKTEQIIAKLQQVKQGLLHDLLTRGIDDNSELRDPERHPEQFQDSPLGRIPKGWRVGGLLDVGSQNRQAILTGPFGSHLGATDFVESGVPLLRIGNVQWGYLDLDNLLHVRDEKAAELSRYVVHEGDLLFARQGATTGRNALVDERASGALINYHIIRVAIDRAKCHPTFLYSAFNSPIVQKQVDQEKGKSTREGVNTATLTGFVMPLPPIGEQERLAEVIAAHDERLASEEECAAKLRILKAGLAEDLLTGRVRTTPLAEVAA